MDLIEENGEGHTETVYGGGYTPLIRASKCGDTEIVAILLEKGADMNVKNNNGKTAHMIVSEKRYISINHQELFTLMENHIRRTKVMTALVIKKGLTQKGDKPLVPYAHRETIHRIASFF